MPNPQLSAGQFANGAMVGKDSSGTARVLTSLTASIDNYELAYVAAVPSAGSTGYCVVQRGALPAGVTTVNVTWNAKSVDGTPIGPVTESYDLVGTPLPPQAVSLSKSSEGYGAGTPPAADPGSGSIVLI